VNKHLKSLLRIGVSVLLLGLLAWRTDWTNIGVAFGKMNTLLWLAAVGVFLVAQLSSSVRWRWMAQPLGFRQSPGLFLGYYFIGMFFNLVLPTSVGGDVVRAWYLDGHSGRRLSAFVSVFADRASGLLVLLTLACLGVALSPLDLPAKVKWGVLAMAGGALLGMGLFGLMVLWKKESIKAWGEGRKKEKEVHHARTWAERLILRLRLFTLSFSHTLTLYVRHPAMVVGTTLLSLVVQAANVLMVLLIGEAVGVEVPPSYYWILVPVVSLLTVLPLSFGGVGIREWGTLALLTPLNVDDGQAAAIGILWTLAQSAANLTGLFFYLFGRFERFSATDAAAEADFESGNNSDSPTDDTGTIAKNMEVRSDGSVCHHPDQGRAGQPATAS
jgi:uncharacterized protein (TIRG00374 family)